MMIVTATSQTATSQNASFSNNNGDIYLSNDFGITWNKSNTSINNWKLIIYNKTGDFLLATTFNSLKEEVNISTYKVLN